MGKGKHKPKRSVMKEAHRDRAQQKNRVRGGRKGDEPLALNSGNHSLLAQLGG